MERTVASRATVVRDRDLSLKTLLRAWPPIASIIAKWAITPICLIACLPVYAQTQVTDNFNRANGGLGSNWTVNAVSEQPLQVNSNKVRAPTFYYGQSTYTGQAIGGNQFSEIQLVSGFSGGLINLLVRGRQYTTAGTADGYIGQVDGMESTWQIIRADNELLTVLASGVMSAANGDTFYFEANGSTLTLKKNGVPLGTATSTTYTTGDTGIGLYNDNALLADNWRGGEIVTGDTTPPSAPTGLSAVVASSTQINLSWTASSDNVAVTSYAVERCQGASCSNFTQIATPSGTTYNDTGRTASTTYRYRVRARDAVPNWSGYSSIANATTLAAPDTQAPTAPTNPAATVVSSTQIDLSWTASSDNVAVTSYAVERCQGASCSNFTQIATPSGTTYNDTGRTASTTYRYRVRARDAVPNWSGYSSIANATTLAAPDTQAPTAPTNPAATVVSSTQIDLSWTASSDNVAVTSYAVERCQGASCSNFTQIATPSGTIYNDTGLTASTTYRYRVRARDAVPNWSGYSGIVSAATQSAPDTQAPTAPTNLSLTAGANLITLNWTASTDNVGVADYRIERCTGASCSSYTEIGTATTTTYGDATASPPNSYSYRVRARDAASNYGNYSTVQTAMPANCD